MTSVFYEPLIERDLAAIPAAAHVFAAAHSVDDLFLSVARFAVLAYAPSLHAKRAVMSCRAAHELRDDNWVELLIQCATYAAEARQPWSEPPLLDPPDLDPAEPRDLDALRDAIASGDRLRAERWLAARLDDPSIERDLRELANDDALLMLDTANALIPLLGEKGRYALLRMPLLELLAANASPSPDEPLERLLDQAIASRGAVETVQPVFVWCARRQPPVTRDVPAPPIYRLARDYAQTLLAHSVARRLPAGRVDEFLEAVRRNLREGESFAEWSFA